MRFQRRWQIHRVDAAALGGISTQMQRGESFECSDFHSDARVLPLHQRAEQSQLSRWHFGRWLAEINPYLPVAVLRSANLRKARLRDPIIPDDLVIELARPRGKFKSCQSPSALDRQDQQRARRASG